MNLPPQDTLDAAPEITFSVQSSVEPSPTYKTTAPQGDVAVESQIDDLCAALQNPAVDTCLGYLCDNEQRRYKLRSIKDSQPASEPNDVISLEKLLDTCSRPILNRKQRFRLAIILASSLLQLQTTPWLSEKMCKEDIFFEYSGQDVSADKPYINQLFQSTKRPSAPPSPAAIAHSTSGFAARSSLIQLGILLLELCFGHPISSRTDLRNKYLVDGKAHNQTDYLAALEWISEVEEEAGLDFQEAVRACFFFDVKPNWTDARFTQSIYAGVVQPLKKVVFELGWADPDP
jgi:hypothetical protein